MNRFPRPSAAAVVGLLCAAVTACGSAAGGVSAENVTAAFAEKGTPLVVAPLGATPDEQVFVPESDPVANIIQVWVTASNDEALKYKELFESGDYEQHVGSNDITYRVKTTELNRNVLLVVFAAASTEQERRSIAAMRSL